MVKFELTEEEYKLLKECLKWNLYFYKEKVANEYGNRFDCQKEQIKKMEELNGKF